MKNQVWSDEEMATIQNKDRLLPSQPYFSKMYHGVDFFGDLENLLGSMYKEPRWDIKTKDGLSYSCMGSDINTLHYLQFLIRMGRFKRVLELGTYIGVSAMFMAQAGAQVTTVEKGEEFYLLAKQNILNNGLDSKIVSVMSDALRYIEDAYVMYDLIFIDCAKESYKELLEMALRRLSQNGLILVDDVFFQGDTLNAAPTSDKGIGVRKMLDYAASLGDYEKVILPIGNGLLMVRKK